MKLKFFEAIYNKNKYVGINYLDKDELKLYKTRIEHILEFCSNPSSLEEVTNYLNKNTDSILLTKDKLSDIRLIPPMFPEDSGCAVVCGFMQTHNVKIEDLFLSKENIPNMFLKGIQSSLKISGDALHVPKNFIALCEEAEIVLIYQTDKDGRPSYKGYTFGNDLTDIGRFKSNNSHLSYAKLCDASVSHWFFPELPPQEVSGNVSIKRDNHIVWNGTFKTGLAAIAYDLDSMVNNLFSFPLFNKPNTTYYVFLGADKSSFHHGVTMKNHDEIIIHYQEHSVTLQNQITCL